MTKRGSKTADQGCRPDRCNRQKFATHRPFSPHQACRFHIHLQAYPYLVSILTRLKDLARNLHGFENLQGRKHAFGWIAWGRDK
jgi:hypothetical protein